MIRVLRGTLKFYFTATVIERWIHETVEPGMSWDITTLGTLVT